MLPLRSESRRHELAEPVDRVIEAIYAAYTVNSLDKGRRVRFSAYSTASSDVDAKWVIKRETQHDHGAGYS